jgi:LacI family transcriptional regulator
VSPVFSGLKVPLKKIPGKERSEKIYLIGYNLLDLNVKYLRSGVIRFLIGQRPEEQTYKSIKKLLEFLSSKKVPDQIEYLPVDIVTSENIDSFQV